MVDILHRVGIVTASPAPVYDALAGPEGVAAWWSTATEGDGSVGGTLALRFPPVGGFDLEVVDLRPAQRVVWRVVEGPSSGSGRPSSGTCARRASSRS